MQSRKMDPIRGPRGGPTNQLFTPQTRPGTLGHLRRRQSASRGSPGRFVAECQAEFMIVGSVLHNCFFDCLGLFEPVSNVFYYVRYNCLIDKS